MTFATRALLLVSAASLLLPSCRAKSLDAPYPPPAPLADAQAGAKLQRTMRLLADSTAEAPNTVRVLFYGQSITRSTWTRDVTDRLRARFPHANIVAENRAVGGFTADLLVRTAEHDVFGFSPDLIVLHDLFQQPADFHALIEQLATRTGADIAIQTTHVRGESPQWDDTCAQTYRDVAKTFGAELVDVRTEWKRYLKDHGLHPMALLQDEAGHLNGAGDALMGALVEQHLVVLPTAPAVPPRTVTVPATFGEDGKLTVQLTGTRVEADVADGAALRVTVDGQPPSTFAGGWQVTRPNAEPGVDWPWEVATPILVRVGTAPVAEEWTLTLSGFDPSYARFSFRARGSVTGDDGGGTSDADFVSSQQRIAIAARDWWTAQAHAVKGRRFVDGTIVRFRVEALHTDVVAAGASGRVVLASGLPPGPHTLVLEKVGAGEPRLTSLRVIGALVP